MTLAFVFPGQGSQSVGMLRDLAQCYPEVVDTFGEASGVLGYDLWGLVQGGPESELMLTERTQPAMLAAGVAVWRVWRARGGDWPRVMAGHSLGEYTALVCSGALAFAEAVGLVAERGRLMQEAVPAGRGAIAAILGLEQERVVELCARAGQGEVVTGVNFNAPGQVVVAGHVGAVERALHLAREAGAKRAVRLPMSVPAHCPLMEAVAGRFRERLSGVALRAPQVPVIHNVDVAGHEEAEELRSVLVRQLYSPVRWWETVAAIAARGVEVVVECGPGKVLAALTRRIDSRLTALPLLDNPSLDKALTRSSEGLPAAQSDAASPARTAAA